MSGCNLKIPEKGYDACSPGPAGSASIPIEQLYPKQLMTTKIIYNYKGKTQKQIGDAIQLEIDRILNQNPAHKFVNSKSHFNKTGGIELQLNFELI